MEMHEVIKFYTDVINDYDSGCFTQEQLAQKYDRSISAIMWCTQYYGYYHTKASSGKNVMFYVDDPAFQDLKHLLE